MELTIVLVAEVEISNVRLLEGQLTSEIALLVIGFLRLSHRKKRGTVFGLRGEPEYQQAALRHLLNICRWAGGGNAPGLISGRPSIDQTSFSYH